jgi:hypothetical protein
MQSYRPKMRQYFTILYISSQVLKFSYLNPQRKEFKRGEEIDMYISVPVGWGEGGRAFFF